MNGNVAIEQMNIQIITIFYSVEIYNLAVFRP